LGAQPLTSTVGALAGERRASAVRGTDQRINKLLFPLAQAVLEQRQSAPSEPAGQRMGLVLATSYPTPVVQDDRLRHTWCLL